MKPGRVFWGVFLLAFGALLMVDRLTNLQIHIALSWKLWPLLIVLWGFGLVIGNKSARIAVSALIGAFLALLLVSAWWSDWDEDREGEQSKGANQVFHEQYDTTIHHASFTLESGAGMFTVRDTSGDLLTAETTTRMGSYQMERTHTGDGEALNLSYRGPTRNWRFGHGRNTVLVRLHPEPSWALRFDVGATRLDVDASSFLVESATVNAGAADVTLKLGTRADRTRVSVSTGASSLKILIPSSSGCEVHATAPLSLKDFRGFETMGGGRYETENFGSAPKRISVEINAGVSSLRIIRY